MVSEPLLWPFLSTLVFINVTPFLTSLPPSQQPPQPFAVEPPTSSSRRPWVLDLQSPSLRSFTLHRPLPFASPLQILLRLRLWRYHWDRLTPIYTLVEASTPSETTRAPTRHSKVLFCSSCAPRAFHAPLHIWVFLTRCIFRLRAPYAPSRALTLPLTSLLTSSMSALVATLLTTLARVSRWLYILTSGGLSIDFGKVNRWLFPQGWLFCSSVLLSSFSRRFHFCNPFLHILLLNEE